MSVVRVVCESVRRMAARCVCTVLWAGFALSAAAHSGFALHKADFYAVLGWEEDARVTAWMRAISSSMIDNYKGQEREVYGGLNFYDYLKADFPGFKCKHRLLFHWGYNSQPWSEALQRKVAALPWGGDSAEVGRFKRALAREQQYRNVVANKMTEELFGFASGGRDAAMANAMVSVVYDVHILGDYTPDNSDREGLQSFASVVGDLINAVRRIDAQSSAALIKDIKAVANDATLTVPERSERLLAYLTTHFPEFLKKAQSGSLKRRIERRGIRFKV